MNIDILFDSCGQLYAIYIQKAFLNVINMSICYSNGNALKFAKLTYQSHVEQRAEIILKNKKSKKISRSHIILKYTK